MPPGYVVIQVSGGFPVLEVGMIGVDDEGGLCPTKVMSPVGQGFHDS